jgi:hypothetical protein
MNILNFSVFLFFTINVFSQLNLKSENADKSIFKIIGFDFGDQSISQGSGFFINSNGYGITNYHVLENIDSAYIVTNDGKQYSIKKIIDYSVKYDLIKFSTELKNSIPVVLNTNSQSKGTEVFALGFPCGMELQGGSTLSKGIISGFRNIDSVDFIQTSTQITHGSSGGGLFDYSGKLIGVTQGTFVSELENVHANLYKVIPSKYISKLQKQMSLSLLEFKNQNTQSKLYLFDYLVQKGDFLNAELIITKLLKNDILNARLWNKYGSILGVRELNKKVELIECFNNAIQLDPDNLTWYCNYAISLSDFQMHYEALEILSKYKNPSQIDFHLYYTYGYCYVGLKQFDKAILNLKISANLFNPLKDNLDMFRKCLYELAYSLNQIKKYTESNEYCNTLISNFEDYCPPYLIRARNTYALGDKKSACEDIYYVVIFGDEFWKAKAKELYKSCN